MQIGQIVRRLVAGISISAMLAVQTAALAQGTVSAQQRQKAYAGSAFANSIRPSTAPATISGDTVVFGPSGSTYQVPLEEFFPGGDTTSGSAGVGYFGQENALSDGAINQIFELQSGSNPQSRAWETFSTTAAQTPPDLTFSDIFTVSEDVLDTVDTYGQCTVQETFEPFPRVISTYEEETCNRRSSALKACTVDHVVELSNYAHQIAFNTSGLAESISMDLDAGTATVRSVTFDRVCTTSGRDDTRSCRPVKRTATRTIAIPRLDTSAMCGADPSATVSSITARSGPGLSLNCGAGPDLSVSSPVSMQCQPLSCNTGDEHIVGSYCGGPGSVDQNCTMSGGLTQATGGRRPYQCGFQTVPIGDDDYRVWSCSEVAVTSRFNYTLNIREVLEDYWTPPSCSAAIAEGYSSTCGVSLDVTPANPGACIDTSIGPICASDPAWSLIKPPPFDPSESRVSRSARKVTMSAPSCGTETSETCWVTPDGTYSCEVLSTDDPLNNSCDALLSRPECTFSRSELFFDPGDPTLSSIYEMVFLCRQDAEVTDTRLVRQAVCNATIPGVGNDLVSQPRESSSSFGKAAAYLSATRMIAQDTACSDPQDPATCSIFEGKPARCKVAVFGFVDCCESPGGIGLGDYIALIMAVGEVDSAVRGLDATNVVRTSYEALVDPVTLPFEEAYSAVSEGFASNINSIFGTTVIDTTEAASSGLIASVQQGLMRQAAEWTSNIFGDAAANALFEVIPTAGGEAGAAVVGGVVQEGVIQLASQLASLLSIVSIAYTIYSVAKLLIQIIWACEESELELAIQRDLKSAHYVGPYCSQKVLFACLEKQKSYCTFSSPLSRIVQQQARPQLGLSWGAPQAPECRGLTVEELSNLDWDRIDLGEWESIILTSGAIPGADELNINALTASGHTLADPVAQSTGHARQNVIDRTFDRTGAIDFEDARTRAGSSLRAQGIQ